MPPLAKTRTSEKAAGSGGDQVLYDTHVVPADPVTDYLTQYSGISEDLFL